MATATNSQAALKQLQAVQKTSQNPNDILASQNQQLGVNSAQDTVTGLRGAINNTTQLLKQVAPSVMGRTASSLVTNAQATKQIGNEQAPISANLTDENNQYGQESQDLSNLRQEAQTAASGIYQGQQDKESYLQNLYNTLYGKEQDAAAAKKAAAAAAEQKREFNASLAEQKAGRLASSSGGGGLDLGGLFGGNPSAAAQASMKQRKGGGYSFVSPNGNAITAAAYAKGSGIPFRTLLSQMAKKGDSGAAQALKFIGNDYGYDPRKVTQQWQADLYKALTGRTIGIGLVNLAKSKVK